MERFLLRARTYGGNFIHQYVATFTGTVIIVSAGMQFAWPSPSLPILLNKNSYLPITNSEGSWIAVMPSIGAPIGGIIAAVIADRIGRKRSILIASPLLLLAWLGTAFARSVVILGCARFLGGIGDGLAYGVLPMYISEIANKKIRGRLGSSIELASTFGACAISIIGLYLSIKVTAIIASLVTLIHFISFSFMPESPYFLILNGRENIAINELKKLTKGEQVDDAIVNLTTTMALKSNKSGKLLDVFRDISTRKALGVIIGLKLVENFSGYHAISFYCLAIFNEADATMRSSTAMIIYSCTRFIMTAMSTMLVDLTGRRILLLISIVGSGCALTVEGVYFYLKYETNIDLSRLGFLPLSALLLYTVTFNIGLATIPMLISSELFESNVKAVCMCISSTFFAVLIVIVAKLFQIVKDTFGMHMPFFIFAICCMASLWFIIYVVPETRGKSLEQIQLEMKGVWSKTDSILNVRAEEQNGSTKYGDLIVSDGNSSDEIKD